MFKNKCDWIEFKPYAKGYWTPDVDAKCLYYTQDWNPDHFLLVSKYSNKNKTDTNFECFSQSSKDCCLNNP